MGYIKDFYVNDGPWYTFLAIWWAANIVLFYFSFVPFLGEPWLYLRWTIGYGLPVAKACAAVINLNSALILIPVCRNFINFARGCFECRRSLRRLFDKNILFHKYCAYMICFATVGHIVAHLFNVEYLVDQGNYPGIGSGQTAERVCITTIVGVTGVIITAALILMVSSATEQIRRSFFELFWYTHHLFIIYYIGLLLHGISGFVRAQTNYEQVPFYLDKPTNFGMCDDRNISHNGCRRYPACLSFNDTNHYCCPCAPLTGPLEPDLQKGAAASWKYIIGPLLLYFCERMFRVYRCFIRPTQIRKVIKHKDNVMELQFTKFVTKPGQYVFINCPQIAQFEWHPFTLTSCPELGYCSVHIRLVGDWTTSLAQLCGFYDESPKDCYSLPTICIDGPFGTASEDFFQFDVAVCVAAGIGVTPFASLLQSVFFQKFGEMGHGAQSGPKKVYFYWICPGFDSWGWFADLLIDLEYRLHEIGEESFLTIKLFMTRGWTDDDAIHLMLHDSEDGDTIVRDQHGRPMRHKMNFFRPQWEKEFTKLSTEHPNSKVGVFFCGPKAISHELHKNCVDFTDTSANGSIFVYHKENF